MNMNLKLIHNPIFTDMIFCIDCKKIMTTTADFYTCSCNKKIDTQKADFIILNKSLDTLNANSDIKKAYEYEYVFFNSIHEKQIFELEQINEKLTKLEQQISTIRKMSDFNKSINMHDAKKLKTFLTQKNELIEIFDNEKNNLDVQFQMAEKKYNKNYDAFFQNKSCKISYIATRITFINVSKNQLEINFDYIDSLKLNYQNLFLN